MENKNNYNALQTEKEGNLNLMVLSLNFKPF